MSFLLDTDHLSAHLRRPSGLAHRFFQYSGRLYTSSVVLAELFVWAYNRLDPTKTLSAIQLRRSGIEVPSVDLLIASVALVYDLTLVAHNTADFQRIPGLRLDDWPTP